MVRLTLRMMCTCVWFMNVWKLLALECRGKNIRLEIRRPGGEKSLLLRDLQITALI